MDQLVDITSDRRILSRDGACLTVEVAGPEDGCVPFDRISAVILAGHGATWVDALLAELARRRVHAVPCGANHAPVALLWPIEGADAQGGRMQARKAAHDRLAAVLRFSLLLGFRFFSLLSASTNVSRRRAKPSRTSWKQSDTPCSIGGLPRAAVGLAAVFCRVSHSYTESNWAYHDESGLKELFSIARYGHSHDVGGLHTGTLKRRSH